MCEDVGIVVLTEFRVAWWSGNLKRMVRLRIQFSRSMDEYKEFLDQNQMQNGNTFLRELA